MIRPIVKHHCGKVQYVTTVPSFRITPIVAYATKIENFLRGNIFLVLRVARLCLTLAEAKSFPVCGPIEVILHVMITSFYRLGLLDYSAFTSLVVI